MSQYHMDINGKIQLMDYSSIYDYMAIVDKSDNFIITLNDTESQNIDIVCRMLEDNRFLVVCDKECDDGKYHIKAVKY